MRSLILLLIVAPPVAVAPCSAGPAQTGDGLRLRSVETERSLRLTDVRWTAPGSGDDPAFTIERTDKADLVGSSTICFFDEPAPPLVDRPQDDAEAFFRTVDVARRMESVTHAPDPQPAMGHGLEVHRFVSPLEDRTIRVRPNLQDAEAIADPQPRPEVVEAVDASRVDARLPRLVAFLDGDAAGVEVDSGDVAAVAALHGIGGGVTPDGWCPDVFSSSYWNQIEWERVTRTVVCIVDADGRTLEHLIEIPLVGALSSERRRHEAHISTHMGFGEASGELVETVEMELRGVMQLTVDLEAGEAVALCVDLACGIERTTEAPEVEFATLVQERWEGTASLRFASRAGGP